MNWPLPAPVSDQEIHRVVPIRRNPGHHEVRELFAPTYGRLKRADSYPSPVDTPWLLAVCDLELLMRNAYLRLRNHEPDGAPKGPNPLEDGAL